MTRQRQKSIPLALVLGAALLAPGIATAQDSTISGTVRDATGLVLPGVTVEARDAAGTGQVTFTDGIGEFTFSGLAPGTYEVTFTLPGFDAPAQVVEVGAGATATLDIEMEIGFEELVVVVGSRAQPRSVTESPVPVDVIRSADFASQGSSDLANQLRTVVPSFNVSIQPISDAATIVRPANLRNLAPDHTLILVNGKRRHRAAVITWLGNGIADGSQGPDISVIPSIAIRQAEVLRDGAAAQYGSDAIAGVMNFQLKDASEGGSLEFRTGAYRDANPGDASTCGAGIIGDIKHSCNGIGGHGQAFSFAGNAGLPLGENGFVNLSLEYGNGNPTSRSIQRNDAQGIISAGNTNLRNPAQVWGSPLLEDDLKLFGNFGHLFDNGLQFYGHTNYASRTVTGGFYFRNPHTRGGVFRGPTLDDGTPSLLVGNAGLASFNEASGTNAGYSGPGCPAIPVIGNVPEAGALAAVEADPNCFTLYSRFPGGFTPQFGGNLIDYSFVSGLRGFTSGGFNWDASANIGTSDVDQFINDTVNASLGYDTPTQFNPGSYRQDDVNLNFDVSYAATDVVHFAAGTEWRNEKFTIGAGGQPSWEIGPYAAQGFSSGSNGFNGYRADTTAGAWSRSNVAVYGDLEFDDPGGRWTVGTALRFENFSDFGTTTNGKVSTRVALHDAFSLRAAVSTGFRAPTPGQQERVQRDNRLHRRAVDEQRRRPVHVRGRGVARGWSAPAGEVAQLQRRSGHRSGAVHLHRRLLPHRHRRPGRPVAGDQSDGARDPGPARGRDPRGAELPGVPVLPERLLDDDSGARPDLDPGARAHDVERDLQPHHHHAEEHREFRDRRVPHQYAGTGTAEHPLELQHQPSRRPLEPDGPRELLRLLLGQRGRAERNRCERIGDLALVAVPSLFRQGAARRRVRHSVRGCRHAGDRRREPAEHIPRPQHVRRRHRREPVRPVLAVRFQRRLLLHPDQLRVGALVLRHD